MPLGSMAQVQLLLDSNVVVQMLQGAARLAAELVSREGPRLPREA